MIRDLSCVGDVASRCDCLVIGAGTVGLILATRLAALGQRVVCLESGAAEQRSDTHPLNAAEQGGTPYGGAEYGRFRCLGGTSTRWGGALIPFQQKDLLDADWPISMEEISAFLPEIESLFGLEKGPYEDLNVLANSDYIARLAKWPPFRNRNVYSLLRNEVVSNTKLEVWINATVVDFAVNHGRVTSVLGKSKDGSSIVVSAKQTVIAAGAIESTRLLLLLQRAFPGQMTGTGLGEGFHDHLSAKVADLEVIDKPMLNRLIGFRFSPNGGMRNMRFELASHSNLRRTVRPCFVHVSFTDQESAFEALRDVFRSLQRRRLPKLKAVCKLIPDIPWLMHTAWWRIVERRLYIPRSANLEVHLVMEQAISVNNRIELSESKADDFGLPLPKVIWEVKAVDVDAMENAVSSFEKCWNSSPLAGLAKFKRRKQDDIARDLAGCGGIFHPGGSTRMSHSATSGVVDTDLRVYGLSNLSVCATSVLPTGGGANPTMMLLLLGLRLVKRLTAPSPL